MNLQYAGGILLSERTDAWKRQMSLPNANRVFLRLSESGSYQLHIAPKASVSIGTRIATLSDGTPVYSSVSGIFDGIFAFRNQICAGVTDDGARTSVPVLEPENRELDSLSADDLLSSIRDLAVVDHRRNDFLWKTVAPYIGKTQRLLIDLTDSIRWSFTNYYVALNNIEDIVRGAKVLCSLLGATKIVFVTDSSRRKPALLLQEAIRNSSYMSVAEVDIRFPSCERTLLSAIYNRQPPIGKTAADIGFFFASSQTVSDLFRSLATGFFQPEQVISVSGEGFGSPCILIVPFGTTWKTILNFCKFKGGAYSAKADSLLYGLPASGITRYQNECLVSAVSQQADEKQCITCGRCVEVCPVGLQPYRILSTKNYMLAKKMAGLCLHCGCCNYVCPSNIPLADRIVKRAPSEEERNV